MAIDIEDKVKRLRYFTKKGPNSWFIQSVKGQYMESYFVSIVPPGGTIVMTGDYDGVIVCPYCKDAKEAIHWMAGATTLSYFAEKVGLGNQHHQKTEYNTEKAAEELAGRICSYFDIESMTDYIKMAFINCKYVGLTDKLSAEAEDFDVRTNGVKLKNAIDSVIEIGLEMRDNFHQACYELERVGILDTWELNPNVYTYQLRWQHQCLMWWAKNVIDKQDVEYFEADSHMELNRLQIGHIYLIRGMGEMKLKEVPKDKEISVLFETSAGYRYYAGIGDVIRESEEVDIEARKKSMIVHNMQKEAELLQALWDGRTVEVAK